MQMVNKKIEQINAEMALLMAKYKDAYQRSRIAKGFEKELYQREMDRCTRRLCELLADKRKLKGA